MDGGRPWSVIHGAVALWTAVSVDRIPRVLPQRIQLMVAYLVIREGSKWTDVFRLIPGRTVTIGRAPTNQIVVKDERCSRHHAEIFLTQGQWTLRDLDSRNGTILEDKPVRGDVELQPGHVILIAHAQLAFVDDLSAAFPESVVNKAARAAKDIDEETVGSASDDSSVLSALEPPTITHRKGQTKFLEQPLDEEDSTTPRVGKAATKLCRLAFELANRPGCPFRGESCS